MRQARATTPSPPSPRRTPAWSWSQPIGDSPIGYERLTLRWWGRAGCWTSSWTEPASQRPDFTFIRPLSAGALAVPAPWPAAGPTLALLQLFLGPANAAFSGHFLLGILDPADELVAGERRDVLPGIECRGVGGQRLAQVSWKLVHHPTGHSRAAHRATVVKGRRATGRLVALTGSWLACLDQEPACRRPEHSIQLDLLGEGTGT